SRNAVSVYEMDKAKPRAEVVAKMADKLGVKESYFFLPMEREKPNSVFQRSRHALTKHHRTIAERWFDWTKYVIDVYLKSYLEMPPLNIPKRLDLGIPDDPRMLSNQDIERIAIQCREYWGLGIFPIDHITAVLENN